MLQTHGGGFFLISYFCDFDFSGKKDKKILENHVAVVQWVDIVLCVSVASKWAAKGTPWC